LALETLDTRGLLCPLPVIRTQDRIRSLAPGSMLVVTASDAGTLQDIPAWCRVHGHQLVTTEQTEEDIEKGRTYRFTICVMEQ